MTHYSETSFYDRTPVQIPVQLVTHSCIGHAKMQSRHPTNIKICHSPLIVIRNFLLNISTLPDNQAFLQQHGFISPPTMTSNAASAADQSSGQVEKEIDVSCVRYPANYFALEIGTVILGPKYNDKFHVVGYFEHCDNHATQLEARCKMFSLAASEQEDFFKKIVDTKKTLRKSGYHHTNIGIISDVWNKLVDEIFLSARQCQQGLKGLANVGFPTGYLKS